MPIGLSTIHGNLKVYDSTLGNKLVKKRRLG